MLIGLTCLGVLIPWGKPKTELLTMLFCFIIRYQISLRYHQLKEYRNKIILEKHCFLYENTVLKRCNHFEKMRHWNVNSKEW